MKFTLPMYNMPELKAFNEVWSRCVTHHADRLDLCLSKELNLTQTCGWPLVSFERTTSQLIGTPNYQASGCSGSHYCSLIVVNKNSNIYKIKDLKGKTVAINNIQSCSGYLLLVHTLGPELYDTCKETFTGKFKVTPIRKVRLI